MADIVEAYSSSMGWISEGRSNFFQAIPLAEEWEDHQRFVAKTINFGIVSLLQGDPKFIDILTPPLTLDWIGQS